jgi:hypothetical protein
VLDEHDAQTRPRELAQRGGLGLVETSRTARRAAAHGCGERPPQLDEARGAGRETVDAILGDFCSPTRSRISSAITAVSACDRATIPPHLRRDEDVLTRSQAPERLEPLEGAADPEARLLVA